MGIFAKIKEKFKSDTPSDEAATEENEKGEVFRLLTPKLLSETEAVRAERRKKIKESENKQIVMHERIVDGEVIYDTNSGENEDEDDDYLYDDFYDGRDPSLIEGFNPSPSLKQINIKIEKRKIKKYPPKLN